MGTDGEVFMNRELLQIVSAAFAGVGFAMIFHIRPKYLPVAFVGAGLSWIFYLGAEKIWESHAIAMMIAALGVTIYSEIGARVVKMPVSVIYTPSIIALIPGSHLYYCLRGFVTDDHEVFMKYGSMLAVDTISIVLGSMIVLTFVSAITSRKKRI